MPIKFECPSCNNSLTVNSQLAGKAGKCPKCAAKITVPATQTASTEQNTQANSTPLAPLRGEGAGVRGSNPVAGTNKEKPVSAPSNLSNVLDQLTESDFNRESPLKKIYTPPKADTSGHERLRRVVEQEKKDKKGKSGKKEPEFGWSMLLGVHNIMEAIIAVGLIVILMVSPELVSAYRADIPFVDWGGEWDSSRGLITIGSLAFLMLICGVVMLAHHTWFYIVALASYVFFCELHMFNVLARMGDRNSAVKAAIWLVLALFCTTYFFHPGSRKEFKVKGWTFALAGVTIGLVAGLLVGGVLYSSEAFVAPAGAALPVTPANPVTPAVPDIPAVPAAQ